MCKTPASGDRHTHDDSVIQPEGPGGNPLVLTPEDRAEVDAVAALADSGGWFPGLGLGTQIRRDPTPIPGMAVGWWRPALTKLRGCGRDKWTWPYLRGIVRGYHPDGPPREIVHRAAEATQPPKPLTFHRCHPKPSKEGALP